MAIMFNVDYMPIVDVRVIKPYIGNNKSYKTSIA